MSIPPKKLIRHDLSSVKNKHIIGQFVDEVTIDLQPGDGLVLYSDGFTEAENETGGEFYGLERLGQVVSQHWAQSAEEINKQS
jgi:serine phosphatase RsbU (regulator of sigma subunit)